MNPSLVDVAGGSTALALIVVLVVALSVVGVVGSLAITRHFNAV
jgi:hypothetical protein